MATLTVRNLDEEIVRRLRIQAAEHREILRASLNVGSQPEARQQAADRMADFRRRTGGRNSATSTELLAESRVERLRSLTGKAAG